MSGICGWVTGKNSGIDPEDLDRMLAAIDYRGDTTDKVVTPHAALGYRWWGERPGKSAAILRRGAHLVACAGTLVPRVEDPAAHLHDLLMYRDPDALASLDGAFAAAAWDAERECLTLIRDPFGVRSLYYLEHQGAFFFATELKQLLALTGIRVEADPAALHKYLTFSFVPGEDVPVKGVKRLMPGHIARFEKNSLSVQPYFTLRESIDERFHEKREAIRFIRGAAQQAVVNRWNGEKEVGVYLSGGIDSAAVALWLTQANIKTRAFTLDFGEHNVEREQAAMIAHHLGIDLTLVQASGATIAPHFMELVYKLDLPFGDAVTGPQFLLGEAARKAGLAAVFNGEGGDQLFGGWSNKPMVAASMYAGLYGDDTREEMYLKSYHRFYGLEKDLYTPEFAAAVGGPGQRRAHLLPYLYHEEHSKFLNRLRLADIALKGSQNILPRAERIANAWGLDVRVPLFDRALAEASFRLPPHLKLHGATEKYILKRILQKHLPRDIVWGRKYGMSVPITDWLLNSELNDVVRDLLSPQSLKNRGLFQSAYVEKLLSGKNDAHETRRRRIGERLWCLASLEAWLRVYIDGRGKSPLGSVA